MLRLQGDYKIKRQRPYCFFLVGMMAILAVVLVSRVAL